MDTALNKLYNRVELMIANKRPESEIISEIIRLKELYLETENEILWDVAYKAARKGVRIGQENIGSMCRSIADEVVDGLDEEIN